MEKQELGLEITELRLGLPTSDVCSKKRGYSELTDENSLSNEEQQQHQQQQHKNLNKAQIVGWPPVRSYRKKINKTGSKGSDCGKMYVKVSKDGAPILRKIDLNTHKGYADLVVQFEELFGCFAVEGGVLRDYSDKSEFVPIYEDKDGDWMLLGDVPWEMFIESCKRLRIMRRTEALELKY
ncbi:hypothetical protein Scep_008288 [Stephania cephalantha]|uniref:Auxin-responsive protein n=1 Tax=Stephania cephalantha TaxID=152367 RepID=A0AAP0PQT5_9MAGN